MEHSVEIKNDIQLLHDWILVFPDAPEEKTESGIFIAEIDQEKKPTGTVAAIGKKVKGLKVNDRVVHIHFFGMIVQYKAMQAYLMREHDVIAVL
jgi:chaperonin GroES